MAIAAIAIENDSAVAAARALGRSEALRFDDKLRTAELAERESLRSQLPCSTPALDKGQEAVLARLLREEAQLESFLAAVASSLPWRLLELGRSLAGRAWRLPGGPATGASFSNAAESLALLEQRVRELAELRAAVLRSRSWWALQGLRRLVGRAW